MHANPTAGTPPLDPEIIAFAQKVFGYARVGETAALRELLEQGMPPNLRNEKGDSLLMLAAYHGHAETVRALMAHGADAELANDRGQLPLAAAAFKGDEATVAALLEGGAAINGAGPDGRTVLMMAAMFNRTALIDDLLARGADPEARDAVGFTARDAAEKMGATDAAAVLERHGPRRPAA